MTTMRVKLSDESEHTATYHQIKQSRLLEGFVPAEEEEEEMSTMCLPLDLSLKEWDLYSKYVSAVVSVESQTKTRMKPNHTFAREYFTKYEEEDIMRLMRASRYLLCEGLEENLKYFIGGLYTQYSKEEVIVGLGIEKDEEYDSVIKESRLMYNDFLVKKIKELVPKVQDYDISFIK